MMSTAPSHASCSVANLEVRHLDNDSSGGSGGASYQMLCLLLLDSKLCLLVDLFIDVLLLLKLLDMHWMLKHLCGWLCKIKLMDMKIQVN